MFISTLGQEPTKTPVDGDHMQVYDHLLREIISDDDMDADQTVTESYENKVICDFAFFPAYFFIYNIRVDLKKCFGG